MGNGLLIIIDSINRFDRALDCSSPDQIRQPLVERFDLIPWRRPNPVD
jgi:hypothetical protein